MSSYTLPEYTLYFDTNTVYSPKPSEPVSGGFLAALAEIRKLTEVVAKAPSIVVQELCYQKTQAGFRAAENLRKNAETIRQVTGIEAPKVADLQALKAGCEKRFQAFLGFVHKQLPIRRRH
jgi:hypothetical protein